MPEDLQTSLREARRQTDLLFSMLHPDALYERPIPERHRLVFYLGHLEAFDWNHMAVWALGESRFNPEFDRLFEAGIDPDSAHLPADRPSDWPSTAEVRAYNRQVRRRIDAVLPNRRLLLITRDFRDNLLSVAGKEFGPVEPLCAAQYVKKQIDRYAAEYRRTGNRALHVKFETLVSSPEVVLLGGSSARCTTPSRMRSLLLVRCSWPGLRPLTSSRVSSSAMYSPGDRLWRPAS